MKKFLLFTSVLAVAGSMNAQELKQGYITWPSSNLSTYVTQWNGGNGTITIDGKVWEDQEFFTSRVKPKARIYNTLTQVDPTRTQYDFSAKTGTDKRCIFWVPVGDEMRNSVKTNALPNGIFDGEVFSMWSYIDHYGNWNSPYGWTPGNFADVAHKNGVAVSGVAQPAFGSISAEWRSEFQAVSALDANAVGKFFYYFGQDGIGYNSEWTGYAPTGLISMHNALKTYMADKNPLWEVIWYAGTTDSGGRSFDSGVGSGGGNTQLFNGASMFLNYNWNNTSTMSTSIAHAKNVGRNPFMIYAGMNMQGGEPKSGDNYPILKDYQYSIGLWGAHSNNMLWNNRNSNGSSPKAMQRTYLNLTETWFGNGVRNPAVPLTINTNRGHSPSEDWAGLSSMMTARSAISGNIDEEPFYSYFNIGNGLFMNWKGQRQHDQQWHNIGVQDYMPTWRWWFAPEFLGRKLEKGATKLSADIVWDDAYMGGSCLQISGTSAKEYLHLFKTHLKLDKGQRIRFIYKLVEGEGAVSLLFTDATKNSTAANVTEKNSYSVSVLKSSSTQSYEDIRDLSYDGWQVKEVKVASAALKKISDDGAFVDMITLAFTDAKDMKLLIGGIEILPSKDLATPATPVVTMSKVLANNFSGVDGKIVWKMNNTMPVGSPVYNSDVNTSLYRVWSQQEGKEPVMNAMTTSWASFVFKAPVDVEASQKIRFGVSAVSTDLSTESDIAWGQYLSMGEYVLNNDIEINKSIIKPNEEFSIKFVDSNHASATWTIADAQTDVVMWTGSGKSVTCPGLAEIGAYTLTVNCNGEESVFPRYISISSEAVGALPEIYTMSIDGDVVDSDASGIDIVVNDSKTFSYTARPADGSASRGIELNEKWFGVNVGQLSIGGTQSFSVAAWVKYNSLPKGLSNFITIENRQTGGWPYNNWGFFWSRIDENGRFCPRKIDTAWGHRTGSGTEGQRLFYKYADSKIDVNAWTHVALIWEFNAEGKMRQKFYINGKQQLITAWCTILKSTAEGVFGSTSGDWENLERICNDTYAGAGNWGLNTYEPGFVAQNRQLSTSDWIAFGGSASDITAVEGCVDDFQVWGKAMTADDVAMSMAGLDGNNLPADVLGYWDFETDCNDSDYAFVGKTGSAAKNKAPRAFWYSDKTATGEGAAAFVMGRPVYGTGCPYISGTAYPVVTAPTWEARRAKVTGSGNSTEGSATINFPKLGDHVVTLTLENGYGSDSKEYPVITVKSDLSAIENVAADNEGMATYVVGDMLFLEFEADGNYSIDVYNVSGVQVAKKAVALAAGQNVQVSLGTPGVYVVKVVKDGKELRAVKVVRN